MKIGASGVYQTKFGELWDKGLDDLVVEAARGALADAELKIGEIEAIYIANKLSGWVLGQNHLGALVSEILQTKVPIVSLEAACASGGVAVREAAMGVELGRYQRVLVVGAEKMSDIDNGRVAEALMGAASHEERESGISFPGLYGLMARAYMERYGLSREDLALVPVKSHKHASLHDLAHFSFEINREQVLASSLVADPLRLLDCSGVSDGAAAVVLERVGKSNKKQVTSYKLNRMRRKMVYLVGSGMATDTIGLMGRESLVRLGATEMAAEMAYTEAGIGPEDVGVAEVHDCFSIAEVMAMEDLGFAKRGEGVDVVKSGDADLGGKRPINTSGGLKACGHPVGATGVKQVVEVVKQLRGEAGRRQVDRVKVGLTQNVGGTGGTVVVNIFTR